MDTDDAALVAELRRKVAVAAAGMHAEPQDSLALYVRVGDWLRLLDLAEEAIRHGD